MQILFYRKLSYSNHHKIAEILLKVAFNTKTLTSTRECILHENSLVDKKSYTCVKIPLFARFACGILLSVCWFK